MPGMKADMESAWEEHTRHEFLTKDLEATLATMAEGMVLVTETAANPVEVHAYLDTLCQQVPARLYGTLAVPKTAA